MFRSRGLGNCSETSLKGGKCAIFRTDNIFPLIVVVVVSFWFDARSNILLEVASCLCWCLGMLTEMKMCLVAAAFGVFQMIIKRFRSDGFDQTVSLFGLSEIDSLWLSRIGWDCSNCFDPFGIRSCWFNRKMGAGSLKGGKMRSDFPPFPSLLPPSLPPSLVKVNWAKTLQNKEDDNK